MTESNEPCEVVSDTSIVQVNSADQMSVYITKAFRKAYAFNLVKGALVRITLMSDGEVRIKKLADDYDVAGAPI